ncbi:integrase core domain-containing protein [Streptomyces sp. NPDC056682]|uniref:integrase core domain-containing protein n=1 Tax=Streptomyces sp. NPDC056682 TaxID=3345909 RepID=UPI0036C74F63
MTLRLVYRFGCLLLGWLRLLARSSAAKDVEILVLRHQLSVLQRSIPKPVFTRGDRAVIAALVRLLSKRHRTTLPLAITPRTVLRWHAKLVARKWTYPPRRPGRPAKPEALRALVLRLARENDTWGYRRIHGELLSLGWKVAASTVWEILKEAGVEPAPQRADRSWARFLTAQAHGILAVDVLHVDTVFLRRLFVLFFIEHGSRRVHIAGVTRNVTADWAVQQARNLLLSMEETRTAGIRYLVRDNAGYFTEAFDAVFTAVGTRVVPILPGAPRMNAIAERWVASCRREATDRILITGERHLRLVIHAYAAHHNEHRPHRSLGQRCPDGVGTPEPPAADDQSRVIRRDRLGGLIHEYTQVA